MRPTIFHLRTKHEFYWFITVALLAVSFLLPHKLQAQNIYMDEGQSQRKASAFILPFVSSSDQLGFAGGLAGVRRGFLQDQATFGGAVLVASGDSYGLYFGGINYQMPFTERWFLDPILTVSNFAEMRSYQDYATEFGDNRSGSNGSEETDYVEDQGWDIYFEMRSKWLLPIGHGKGDPLHVYHLNNGLLSNEADITGGTAFNPLTSGRTYITFSPFYRSQEYDADVNNQLRSSSNGIQLGLLWNNKDFEASPSKGERIQVNVRQDFGAFNSDDSWTTWEFEASKFISLGSNNWARQQVLAFDFWTSDTPSWNNNNGNISNRAPDFYSPKLGGFNRMRAYPFERFNDRSAIYYAMEYRVIPEWNPLGDVAWIDRWLDIDWWQIVPFAELGRVSNEYDLGTLHKDMKWDAGIGLRFMMKKSVIRLDWAMSEESSSVWFFLGQSF
ncbi:MAG: hypothetical protein L3J39_08090 [Verrucomicrobiales bacterium]|nr:hypothetical protein [Verrucomicrobiales bacterium]